MDQIEQISVHGFPKNAKWQKKESLKILKTVKKSLKSTFGWRSLSEFASFKLLE
jgi:hypothetical protein